MVRISKKGVLKTAGTSISGHRVQFGILGVVALVGTFCFAHLLLQRVDRPENRLLADAHSAAHLVATGKPFLVYGTAWKKGDTAKYVHDAIVSGFRFVDTACQPKHYNEAGVGDGWTSAVQELGLERQDIYLQTKFTPFDGQDPNNLPYAKNDPPEEQCKQSLVVSLQNLKTEYLDSLVMHSPYNTVEETMKVWRVMESFVDEGKVRRLGISNCYDYDKFTAIYQEARIKPRILQNRLYAESNFDTELRKFAKENGIWYQSFWTLTANRQALALPEVKELAAAKNLSPQTYMFAFLMSLGYITPLSGTTSPVHMMEDVAVMERMQGGEAIFETEEELEHFAKILGFPEM